MAINVSLFEPNPLRSEFLPANMEGLTPEMIRKAEVELHETPTTRQEGLKELKCLLKSEKDLQPLMDEKFLLRFLRVRKFNPEAAFKTVKGYYSYKANYSRIISDIWPSEVKHVFEQNIMMILPHRDQQGRMIGVANLGTYDLYKVSMNDLVRTVVICIEIATKSEATQVCGLVLVLNLKDISFHHLRDCASYRLIRPMIRALQDCIPLRIKALHIINEPRFFNTLFNFLKKFLSKKMQDRFQFHGGDLANLHNQVSPEILPEEFGGQRGPMDSSEFSKEILAAENHYTHIIQYGYK